MQYQSGELFKEGSQQSEIFMAQHLRKYHSFTSIIIMSYTSRQRDENWMVYWVKKTLYVNVQKYNVLTGFNLDI